MKNNKKYNKLKLLTAILISITMLSASFNVSADSVIVQQTTNNSGFMVYDDYEIFAQGIALFGDVQSLTYVQLQFNYVEVIGSSGIIGVGLSETCDAEDANWETQCSAYISDLPDDGSWVTFDFDDYTPIDGDCFLMVEFLPPLPGGDDVVEIGSATGNLYISGWLYGYDGTDWTDGPGYDEDLTFRLYGDENQDPNACFTYDTAGLVVDVDAGCSSDSDGTITTWQWDWTNDGSYDDTGETETHVYPSDGTYTIKLRVIDNNGGLDTHTDSVTVSSSGNNAPTAAFTNSTSSLTVDVDASGSTDSDGTIISYQWDWTNDDSYDNTSASATESHTYSSADTYTIKLRVIDNDSATGTITHQVTVSTGGGSSGFTGSDNTMWYLIAGVVAAIVIGVVVYLGPVKKKHRR